MPPISSEATLEYQRQYRQSHKDEYNAWKRQWRKENADKRLSAARRYKEKHSADLLEMERRRREDPARIEQRRKWFEDHPGYGPEYSKKWRKDNPEKARLNATRQQLKKYGLTIEDYERMLADQGERCALCRTDEPGGNVRWRVDHDHKCCPSDRSCGRCVRGLLCHNCNTGLGNFKDETERLKAAIAYLEKHQTNGAEPT